MMALVKYDFPFAMVSGYQFFRLMFLKPCQELNIRETVIVLMPPSGRDSTRYSDPSNYQITMSSRPFQYRGISTR